MNNKTEQLEEELKRAQDICNNLIDEREWLANIVGQIKRMLLAKYESEKAAIVSMVVLNIILFILNPIS